MTAPLFDRAALAARWAENFGLDLEYPIERALAEQEADHVAELVAAAVAAERDRCRRLLTLPALHALRCIPDGQIRNGCVVHDGGQVRERLRQAYLAVRDGGAIPSPTPFTSSAPLSP